MKMDLCEHLRKWRALRARGAKHRRMVFPGMLLCLWVAATPSLGHVAESCKPISGFDRVLRARGVFVGDMHGTNEAPAFVRALICHALRSGRPVLLALEYPSDQQRFLEEFLHGRAANPQRALLASPFWSRPSQDGRTSRAMLRLLVWIRGQIAMRARIRVVAFDWQSPRGLSGTAGFNARDGAMAARLRQKLALLTPKEFPIIFTGNVHARKTRGLPFINAPPGAASAEPLGYRLRDLPYLHLNISYSGGSGWVCYEKCGTRRFGKAGPAVSAFSIRPSSDPAYDLEYFVGSISASPPAAARLAIGK
jgi:hypothetical protein